MDTQLDPEKLAQFKQRVADRDETRARQGLENTPAREPEKRSELERNADLFKQAQDRSTDRGRDR